MADVEQQSQQMVYKGRLEGHDDWVTQIATSPRDPDLLLSSSRDKSIIMWKLGESAYGDKENLVGTAQKSLHGHSHFVSDVVMSSDGNFALTGSWDSTMRLWNLETGKTTRRFAGRTGHQKDVTSVAFSADNRQIVSASRDKTMKLWNTLAHCKYTITGDGPNRQDKCHEDWISCVRFSPATDKPVIVSASWDRMVKVWNLANCKITHTHHGHNGYVNTVTVSPDGSLCASGGKDGKALLWDLNENKHLYTLDASGIISALCFSPNRYWLCAAVGPVIKIWDLEDKKVVQDLKVSVSDGDVQKSGKCAPAPQCTSIAWSSDGQTLFGGFTDNYIRAWEVSVGGGAQLHLD